MKDRDEERNNYIVEGQQNTTASGPSFSKGWIVSSAGENLYPLDSAIGFPNTSSLDNDVSTLLNNWGLV